MTDHDPPILKHGCDGAGAFEVRCANGTACVEVTARLDAGHRTKYVEGCAEHGEELLHPGGADR